MSILKKTTLALALGATTLASATPAMAENWGGGYGGHERHHDDGVGAAVGIGIAALVVGAIIASSSHRNQDQRYARSGSYYERDGRYYDREGRECDQNGRYYNQDRRGYDQGYGRGWNEDNRRGYYNGYNNGYNNNGYNNGGGYYDNRRGY